jgi:xylulokinase
VSTEATIVVTLDIGGSAAKASGYDAARQVSLGTTAVNYPTPPAGQDPGMFDPDGWWQAAVAALRGLRDRIGQPAERYLGVTVSAIRIPFVLLDASGDAVMPGLLNRDRRAAPQVVQAASAVGAAELYRVTGHWPAPEFGLPKLLWVRDFYPSAWRATRTVLQLHDWFIYRLCGVLTSELSSAAMSQLIDFSARTWASDVLDALDIPQFLLPGLQQAGTLAGPMLADVAEATGFARGTPVHVGGGDTHMSAVSADPAGQLWAGQDWTGQDEGAHGRTGPVIVAGTTAPVMLLESRACLPRETSSLFPLLLSRHVVADMTAVEANAGPTGGIADRLAGLPRKSGELGAALAARGLQLADAGAGDELVVLAGNPFFSPEGWARVPPPTVIGLRDEHRPADLMQACLRGICYAMRSVLACVSERRGTGCGPVIVSGGMSRNAEWSQLLADVVGQPVTVPPLARIAGRAGAYLVAGPLAAGASPACADLRVHDSAAAQSGADREPAWRTFIPNPEAVAMHATGFARYQKLYRAAQPDSQDRLVTGARTR